MKYIWKNRKGITLIELLVVLGIMGIIISVMFSFFLSNYKTFYQADDQIEAQYKGQMAMNKLIDHIVDAQRIVKIEPIIADNEWHDINKIILKNEYVNDEKKERIQLTQFDYNDSSIDNKMNYGNKKESKSEDLSENEIINSMINNINTREYASNIIQFQIKLLGPSSYSDGSYDNCKGMAIKITSKVNTSEVDMVNEVYFRNWKKP